MEHAGNKLLFKKKPHKIMTSLIRNQKNLASNM